MFPTPQTLGSDTASALRLCVAPTQADQPPAPTPHLLIPCVTSTDDACQAQRPTLALPHLQRLLALPSHRTHTVHAAPGTDPELTLTPPHEWALAMALGLLPPDRDTHPTLSDGQLPWAAWAAQAQMATPHSAAAWFTPCHQEVGAGQVTLHTPDRLALSDAHSQALVASLQPLAADDGLRLTWVAADRWLAEGDVLTDLPTASLDRVVGRHIGPWLSTGPQAAGLRRLQSEAQMLFYTHPANDGREAQGLAPINAFWISGSGVCPDQARRQAPELVLVDALRAPALQGDWATWQQAWQALDADVLPAWLAHAQQGLPMRLTLCGDRASLSLTWAPRSQWQTIAQRFLSFFGTQRLSVFDLKL